VRLFRRTKPAEVVIREVPHAVVAMDVCSHGEPIIHECPKCDAEYEASVYTGKAAADHACPRCFVRFPTSASLLTHMTAHTANDWAPDDRAVLTYEGIKMTDDYGRDRDPIYEDSVTTTNSRLAAEHGAPTAGSITDTKPPVVVAYAGSDGRPVTLAEPAPFERADCPHCRGTGKTLTTSDLLRESVALIGDHGDDVVREFYGRLLDAAPGLAELFPADLLTEDAAKGQRDKLLQALVALANLYDPESAERMTILDTRLAAFGLSHGAFYRASEGVTRGATLDEYQAVKVVLFGTLHDFGGSAWLSEYDTAWSAAYDYAAGAMLFHGMRSQVKSARYAR
jgi:hemoglobin-like flavoprotein